MAGVTCYKSINLKNNWDRFKGEKQYSVFKTLIIFNQRQNEILIL